MEPRQNPLLRAVGIKTIEPDGFNTPHVFVEHERPGQTKAELLRLLRKQTAKEFLGKLVPGVHRFGLTKGQFSLIDLIDGITEQVGGKAEMMNISTWTVARADLAQLAEMLSTRFTAVRFLLDNSFQRRQPGIFAYIRKCFGDQAIVVTRNHAKFITIKKDAWRLVVRTSMNLNYNPRLEDVDIKDDAALFGFLDEIMDEIFGKYELSTQEGKSDKELEDQLAEIDP